MEELQIFVDENSFDLGIREILKKIRPSWASSEVRFKVSFILYFSFYELEFKICKIFFEKC